MQKTSIDWTDYRSGYVTGMTEGDGTIKMPIEGKTYRESQWYWRVALKDLRILKRLRQHLRRIGVRLDIKPFSGLGMNKLETRRRFVLNKIHSILNYNFYHIVSDSYRAGYLAGIFDAEGSWSGSSLRIYNSNKLIRNKVEAYAGHFDFKFEAEVYFCEGWPGASRLCGDRYDVIRFLCVIRCVKSSIYLNKIRGKL